MPGGARLLDSNGKAKFRLTLKRIPVENWDAIVTEFDGVCQEMTVGFRPESLAGRRARTGRHA